MDLSQSILLQRPGLPDLDINSVRDPLLVGTEPLTGFSVEQANYSSVSVTAFTEDTPQVDGVDSYDPYLGGRQIVLMVNVYGATHGLFWDNVNALNQALQAMPKAADTSTYPALPADGRRKLSFYQDTDSSNPSGVSGYFQMYLMVRPIAMPRFVIEKSASSGTTTRGYAAKFQVSLIAEDPYRYLQATRTVSRTGSGTLTVNNYGTTIAWPVVTIGGGASATPVSLTLGSETVTHSSVPSGGIVDTYKSAASTVSTSLTSYSFFSIPPGTSTITVSAGSGTTVSLVINEAFV
jgi:hypothetical protein